MEWTEFKQGTAPSHPALKDDIIFINNIYQVNLEESKDGFVKLSIKRRDKQAIHDWRDLQRIKNEIVGKEREAFEIYPAESRLVDTANQYWLWVFPEGQKIECGFENRMIVKGHDPDGKKINSRQRPFDKDPEDAIDIKSAMKVAKEYMED